MDNLGLIMNHSPKLIKITGLAKRAQVLSAYP